VIGNGPGSECGSAIWLAARARASAAAGGTATAGWPAKVCLTGAAVFGLIDPRLSAGQRCAIEGPATLAQTAVSTAARMMLWESRRCDWTARPDIPSIVSHLGTDPRKPYVKREKS